MSGKEIRRLELLAPARDLETGRQAILHGADAVYIGPEAFGARSKAGNSVDDIKKLVEFASPFGVKIYATVNTIIYDNELRAVEKLAKEVYQAGVDALIVQDLGLLMLDLPPIALHASTQCDTRTPAKAKFLADCGFSQIVIPRESSLSEIKALSDAAKPAMIEAFVHGALCVSYSGDCQASFVNNGRSANRGECAQMCRLPYDLIDGNGMTLGRGRHYLSLRDMNRIGYLSELADAGVSSFKIEGRLKDAAYVKNVVAAYRQTLDKVIAQSDGKYRKASRGEVSTDFTPDLSRSFNRGFTPYFLNGKGERGMSSQATPKSLGKAVGTVVSCKGNIVTANLDAEINNGDGMTYITPAGASGGFRVNRADGERLVLSEKVNLTSGSRLFRNYDRKWEMALAKPTASREIGVKFRLYVTSSSMLCLEGKIEGASPVTSAVKIARQIAQKPDNGHRSSIIAKLGDTPFAAVDIIDEVSDLFIPASAIAQLRRDWVAAMLSTLSVTTLKERRKRLESIPPLPKEMELTRHDNIANHAAEKFYRRAGGFPDKILIPHALETDKSASSEKNLRVMTTRYCLRRELGACLKDGGERKLKGPLHLKGAGFTYRLDFDCRQCRMHVIANPQ